MLNYYPEELDRLDIISGITQGSIVGPILFNIFFNDFFCVILIASAHNYADDNTLTSFGKTLEDLIKIPSPCQQI